MGVNNYCVCPLAVLSVVARVKWIHVFDRSYRLFFLTTPRLVLRCQYGHFLHCQHLMEGEEGDREINKDLLVAVVTPHLMLSGDTHLRGMYI